MDIQILYFARLRETLGCSQECLSWDEQTPTVGKLRAFLARRGEAWEVLTQPHIRCAVGQEMATEETPLTPNAEIAFFPPVTGG